MPNTSQASPSTPQRRLLPVVHAAGFSITPERMQAITPLIRERIKLLRDVLTAADFFFVDQLPPYDPAELIPQKGDAAMALKVLTRAKEVLAQTEFKHDPWIKPYAPQRKNWV